MSLILFNSETKQLGFSAQICEQKERFSVAWRVFKLS